MLKLISYCKKIDKNLWFLTEERPKKEVLKAIFQKFAEDRKLAVFVGPVRILPILENGRFTFTYEVIGFRCNKVNKVFIKTVSGNGSFADFLVFYQKDKPTIKDEPIYIIEETKTDDKESRNTGVYQRCSKFVYVQSYYPKVSKIMLYNLQVSQKEKPTATYVFGTRLLLALGVKVLGKKLDENLFVPFKSVDEIVKFKKRMQKAPQGNVPISIIKFKDKIIISGRLFKSRSLAHDPNIGALSLISAVLRKLGWRRKIIISQHGLEQKHLKFGNKFVKIANELNLEIEGLDLPENNERSVYWKYETEGEKLGTIFIHLVIENFTEGYSIFENHAGCEKSYFMTKDGNPIPLKKYSDRKKYKAGDKSKIISIPDLILVDFGRNEIINIEGKKYQFRKNGIKELKGFVDIEKNYIKKYYPKFKIIRTVVLYGSKEKKIIEIKIGFLLNENGDLILGVKSPELFKKAIKNLIDFWS